MKYISPFKLEVVNSYGTILDAVDSPTLIQDIELGWTDTSTGAYVDPEEDAQFLQRIVDSLNSSPSLASQEQYPDTKADGVVFCGKCGKKK